MSLKLTFSLFCGRYFAMTDPPLREKLAGRAAYACDEIIKSAGIHLVELAELINKEADPTARSRAVSSKIDEISADFHGLSSDFTHDRGLSLGFENVSNEFHRLSEYIIRSLPASGTREAGQAEK